MESIFLDHSAETLEERIQLIRILSRSSTLPRVKDILIRSMMSRPDGFFIIPNHSINIGTNILANPIAALLCMRYGLEWQIWYRSMPEGKKDIRLCDLAACRVAARFYELIPQPDKNAIDQIPTDIAEIIRRFLPGDDYLPELCPTDYQTLGLLHNQAYPEYPIEPGHFKILKLLALPTEALLMHGGDLRLNVDPIALLNQYGCRPFPRPEALTFASSTATSVSNLAFSRAEVKRQFLIDSAFHQGIENTLEKASVHLKNKLRKALSLPETATLILAPSGTDISLQLAGICQAIYPGEIVHILVAADETGSGVPLALEGRHFSNRSALGYQVTKGERIEGFRPVRLHSIRLRDDDGSLKSDKTIYEEVYRAIEQALEKGHQPVLHVMDQSKLGYTAPSAAGLASLEEIFGDRVLKVVDNSQLRMDQEDIRSYNDRNYLMTITGSKYFTGPPFSGALIIPENLSRQWEPKKEQLPAGLQKYFCKNECPHWGMASELPECFNLGVFMRWYASIIEIERYFQTPIALRYLGIEMFCDHVASAIRQSPFLQPLNDMPALNPENGNHRLKNRRTIFPFFIRTPDRVLDYDEISLLYRLLNKNLTESFDAPPEDRIASQACHIGQPVRAIHPGGSASAVVRISLGSRVISESWKDHDVSLFFQKIEEQMTQVDTIIRKIEFLVENELYKIL